MTLSGTFAAHRSVLVRGALAVAAIVALVGAHEKTATAPVLVEAAHNLLAALDEPQRTAISFSFDDAERYTWDYRPVPRKGLALREMTPYQKHLAHALLSAALSQRGYRKATTIMSIEDVLKRMENDSGERRNPEKYYFSIFGTPSDKNPWALRVDGHHLSLNLTVVGGRIVAAPAFFGSNPHEVRVGTRKGLRVLHREEDWGRELMQSLTPAQKQLVLVAEMAYPDILSDSRKVAEVKDPKKGLPVSQLNAKQRELLDRLIGEYVGNFPEDVAAARLDLVKKAGKDLHFAWAGVAEKGGPHYYRIQGPTFLIEYNNTQNEANHVHSVWREWGADWGGELLKAAK
jgi:hypothetical protein